MKHFLISLLLGTLTMAQELPTPLSPEPDDLPTERPQPPADPKALAMEKLFSNMGTDDFAEALEEAKKADIHPQVILEARFLHLIDMRDTAGLAAMAPELLDKRDAFDPDNSEVFSVKEDWLAIIHYTQALAALQKGNKADFKKHITEAFWLSPRQGQAFAPHIDKLRLEEAMKSITLDPARVLQAQDGSKPYSLGELMKGHKATVLHFWSPMSQEVQINMPDFVMTTQSCADQNIAVISVLVGRYPNIAEDAEIIRKEDAAKARCTWLVDSNKNTLANLLRVTDIPTMVIASSQGKIMFNGHPSDKNFWKTIQKIAPDFKRPNNPAKKKNPAHGEHGHIHGDG
ncbi:MAG: hypothetical protein KJO79_03180 [Verrucomicrobiae bacterium]|nr:hypothetical protein [Verrucomicrobiae bacterium]NNJ86158.1 hypothetical protein [Akkermansiaceae bacterium]